MIDNETYAMIKKLMPIPCVDLIVHIGDRILLCKRLNSPAKGEWWIPGGRILKGETLAHAVHRKAKEELGFEIEIERLVGAYDNIWAEVHTPSMVYLVKPTEQAPVVNLDSQHSARKWVSSSGIKKMKLHPYLRQEIEDSRI